MRRAGLTPLKTFLVGDDRRSTLRRFGATVVVCHSIHAEGGNFLQIPHVEPPVTE